MGFGVFTPPEEAKPRAKKEKLTSAQIVAKLEETGIDFTPIGLGPWSHSKLKVLQNCPLKFYLQYIIKQDPKTKPEVSVVTENGKAAHRILEFVLAGRDIKKAYGLTRPEYKTLTDEQWEELVVPLEYNIANFKERVDEFAGRNGIKRIFQELRIGVTKDWKPTGFFADDVYFRGVIDLVIQMEDGNVILADHKLGTSAVMGMRNFNDQLDTYRVLFHAGVEPTQGSTTSINHIREGEVTFGEYMDTEQTHDSLLNRLEFSIQGAIDQVLEMGEFKHMTCTTCKYCDYRPECISRTKVVTADLRKQESETKKWFEIKKVT